MFSRLVLAIVFLLYSFAFRVYVRVGFRSLTSVLKRDITFELFFDVRTWEAEIGFIVPLLLRRYLFLRISKGKTKGEENTGGGVRESREG